MEYTSQYFCNKTVDDKMALYRECCFKFFKLMLNKVTFVGFRGVDGHPPDPLLVSLRYGMKLLLKH